MEKHFLRIILFFFFLVVFVVSCAKTPNVKDVSLDEVINIYRKAMQGDEDEFKRLKYVISKNCKVVISQTNPSETILNKKQFLNGLRRLYFTSLISGVELTSPVIYENQNSQHVASFTEGYLYNNEQPSKVKTELLIAEHGGSYQIEEIHQVCLEPNKDELVAIFNCRQFKDYNPQKGIGARYLGGGHFNSSVSISPDNTKIVFTSLKNESSELYIMNLDGSGLERLTTSPYWEVLPLFTSDGQHIIFLSDQKSYQGEPYILRIDTREIKRFLPQTRNVRNIAYSPDGSMIAFTAAQDKVTEIFIRNCHTNEIRQLTSTGREKLAVVFSSDGKNLFFSEKWYEYDKKPPLFVELFSIGIDGKDLRQLTNDRHKKVPVAHTTDKQLFYILRNDDYDNELWIIGEGDSTGHRIISAVNGMNCAWLTPDESAILFKDDRNKPYKYDVFSVKSRHPYEIKRITKLGCYISDLSLSKDSRYITLIAGTSDSPGRGKGKILLIDLIDGSQRILGKNY